MHTFTTHVYLEDVDAGGIVYHANHLKYAERARTAWLAAGGVSHAAVMAGGAAIIVRALNIDYLAPLRLEDEVRVQTLVQAVGGASATLQQEIHGPAGLCASLRVTLVYTEKGRPQRWPAFISSLLTSQPRE